MYQSKIVVTGADGFIGQKLVAPLGGTIIQDH